VVLATGGFASSSDILSRYISRGEEALALRAAPGNTGD
jgi:hypothetical protein